MATVSAVPALLRQSGGVARTVGLWSSLGAAAATAAGTIVFILSERWTNLASYAAGFNTSKLVGWFVFFLLTLFFVVVVASIHAVTPARSRLLSSLGLAFAIMYATICIATCALQFTFVRNQIHAGNLTGLEPWVAASPISAMFALDSLAFFLQGMSLLVLAPLFTGSRTMAAIRWVFVVFGLYNIGSIVMPSVTSLDSASGQTMYRATTVVWGALLTIGMLLVARAFQRRLLPGLQPTQA